MILVGGGGGLPPKKLFLPQNGEYVCMPLNQTSVSLIWYVKCGWGIILWSTA